MIRNGITYCDFVEVVKGEWRCPACQFIWHGQDATKLCCECQPNRKHPVKPKRSKPSTRAAKAIDPEAAAKRAEKSLQRIEEENSKRREEILGYLADHPGSTHGEICHGLGKTCSGAAAKVKWWLGGLFVSGEILIDSEKYILP